MSAEFTRIQAASGDCIELDGCTLFCYDSERPLSTDEDSAARIWLNADEMRRLAAALLAAAEREDERGK